MLISLMKQLGVKLPIDKLIFKSEKSHSTLTSFQITTFIFIDKNLIFTKKLNKK